MRKLSLLLLLAAGAHAQEADREGIEFFEKKIRPVLVDRCYSCHSAEAKKLKGDLYVDSREGLLKGGELGPAIVPGDPDKSLLIKAIRYTDEELKMPPKGKLTKEVVADFEAWIKRGAPDPRAKGATAAKREINIDAGKKYWAFQPLKPGTGSIDALVRAKQKAAGIAPNGPASKRLLIRRATFDLLGIPPTPAEIDQFLADDSADAYPKLIDRLLARPEFGEKWARHWLDIARFAESHGFEQDYDRENAYHYRDFIIKAFNSDLPYTQFVGWQVAGDELAPENPLAWMATGFLGAGAFPTQLTENEFESARYDELDNMASTTSSAFLGLSVGCARCHDHKFDPFPSKDYYRLASTFTSAIRAMAELHMDPEGDKVAAAAWEKDHPPLVAALEKFEREELPSRFDRWAAGKPWDRKDAAAWTILDLLDLKSNGGTTFQPKGDGSVLASTANPKNDKWTIKAKTRQPVTAIRVEALKDPSLKKGGPGRADNGNFALSDFRVTAGGKPLKLKAGAFTHQQNGSNLAAAAAVDGDKASGWAVDPQFGKDHAAVFELAEPLAVEGQIELVFDFEFATNAQHSIGRPRISITTRPAPVGLEGDSWPQPVAELMERMRKGAARDAEALAIYSRIDPEAKKLRQAVEAHVAAKPGPKVTKVLVTTEGLKPLKHHADDRGFPHFYKQTFVLARGDVNKKVGPADPGFLQVLMRSPESTWSAAPTARTPGRRAALASWLTDVENGAGALAARVIVNRLWALHFGRGIVATPNDFGAQGEPPSHPELLEYLASELIRNGWKLKPIHRLMMTSLTYQQSVEPTAASKKIDPDNRLFWRRDARRIEAEAVRDSLLDVGGLLDRKMYGPGTLDENMARRSIYFFIKRSKLIPMMMVFDAPEPLVSQGERPTTTIAPQALLFLNSPLVRRAAAGLAKAGSIEAIYLRALGRPPSEKERAASAAFLESQAEAYRKDGKADLSWVDFAHAILCLNEFVYVD
jgi:hypothetical protein